MQRPPDSNPGSKIIGGMFGLELPLGVDDSPNSPVHELLAGPHLKLASARSAFRLLELRLAPKSVWLPSYLCGVVLSAFLTARVNFYPVDRDLCISSDDWLRSVKPNDIVIFIDYFGFCLWSEWGAEVRRRGAWVVEDACQAMLNTRWCEYSHYVIFSPRKFVGVPDGGILIARSESPLPEGVLPPPPPGWWLEALAASQGRACFDRKGGERQWFALFQKSEAAAPMKPARMSELSALLLTHTINFQEIAGRRRRNYLLFASLLPEFAIFTDLPAEVVPLGFPIRITERDRLRQALFRGQIFPPLHWPLDGIVPEEFTASHALAGEIMTLPCDQRMDEGDISRVVRCMRENT